MMYQRPCSPIVVLVFLLSAFCLAPIVTGQSATATLSGTVEDQNGAVIPGAAVTAVNTATTLERQATTDSNGSYTFPLLPPGTYIVRVQAQGFTPVENRNVVLNVGDRKALQIQLKAGDVNATVQVVNEAPLINESPAVGTVVDHKYVENTPLNGRSIQNLILLTPGVVTNSPQATSGGEFSVNGQRTESNYYIVDGMSANTNIDPLSAARPGAVSGSLPAATALGTTQAVVPLDALEEFRVQSSTYSAEYGRSPGGQFSFVTRSGTNQWHGTAFDYLRNNVFDANDWFNNYSGLSKPVERQNDFGGTFSGPVLLPRFGEGDRQPGYNGRNRTFFFFTYEGLRLLQPQAAAATFVPDTYLRTCAPSPLQQALNAFPQRTINSSAPNCANPDPGNGLTPFTSTWSNPSNVDSTGIRLDHVINDSLRFFFRFSNTASSVNSQNLFVPSVLNSKASTIRTYTLGVTKTFSSRLINEFRLNYSSNAAAFSATLINFGGAQPVDLLKLQGLGGVGNATPDVVIALRIAGHNLPLNQFAFSGKEKQWNTSDTFDLALGPHRTKFGFDFRRLRAKVFKTSPVINYQYFSASSVRANSVDFGVAQAFAPAQPINTNFSAFAQDDWKLTQRLNVSMGLRWEVNPAPGAPTGNLPYTVQGNSLSTLTLASQGTPLWKTTWFNFAPRLGVAYVLRKVPSYETVVRGGGGVFFDTGQQLGSFGYDGPGFSAGPNLFGGFVGSPGSFPFPSAQVSPAIVNPPVPPFRGLVFAFPPHLQLPYTLQWNLSIEQALGKAQALTVSYVGANGRRLLEQSQINVSSVNANFGTIAFLRNGLTSDYNAMQVQFQRRLARGFQALASYTWAHAIDFGSQNSSVPYVRGNSDFDVRNNLSGAFSYDLPTQFENGVARALLHHWGLDYRLTARSGFPVTLNGNTTTDLATGQTVQSGLDLVPGQPVYIFGLQCAALYNNGKGCPGGRAINPNAFRLPVGCTLSSCSSGSGIGNAPRNFVRGFGAWQMDIALRRQFQIYERLKLQFRVEAFNILNHPNFGAINSRYCSLDPASVAFSPGCTFGQATATLANSLVGLSPIYQVGGARSMQFALKLMF